MRRASGRLAVSIVLVLLGFLVVVQLRSQATTAGLGNLSAQDLTVLVANLTTRNNQLRTEISALQQQRESVSIAVQNGDTSAVQIRADLSRIQGWSGTVPVTGAGVKVIVDGPLPGDAVGQLINELRNAGSEGIAIGGVRDVPGVVVTGPAGSITVGGVTPQEPLELLAVGQPEALSGSLTRAGGPIAQLGAQYPAVVITVLAMDSVTLPATDRDLTPKLGKPRL
jgi:uncharacterized protein YlxW (UPF0749 family)